MTKRIPTVLSILGQITVGMIVVSTFFQYGTKVQATEPSLIWIAAGDGEKDYYAAFRGRFHLAEDAEVDIRSLGASWYGAWLDGKFLTEGPARFPIDHPQYESQRVQLKAGPHMVCFQVHYVGFPTRMMPEMPPFLSCQVIDGDQEIPITWKSLRLAGYQPQVRRINPILGWIEWCDTRHIPTDWQQLEHDDSGWQTPIAAKTKIGRPTPLAIAPVLQIDHALRPMAEGTLTENFGYKLDDVPARFFLRDLANKKLPPQGRWRRYDLGRVRLGKPRFVLDLPAGAVVEFAYAETLQHNRVAPYITLSTGPSCNLDHYIARGGVQEFSPLTPKGGRYLEIHVIGDPEKIKYMDETYVERSYHGPAEGSFLSGDPLLDRIWHTGIETYRACAEDTLTDNPTRERGEWTGDVVAVGMDIAGVAYADLRLFQRGLVHSAQCAREDGQVAGLAPGTVAYLATYACLWTNACVHYYEMTGDRELLETLYPAAVKNMASFQNFVSDDGLADEAGWAFIDWGYVRNEGPSDMAFNLHYLSSLRAMKRWCSLLDREQEIAQYEAYETKIEKLVRSWLEKQLTTGNDAWQQIGYHIATLSLRLGLIDKQHEAACIASMKQHILHCFPNDPTAPRLSAPDNANRRLITPYFAHYAFPPLIERGEMDFVLDQYRKCWGWALEDDRKTWVEVFDTRWSHAHQWAGAPTWQLSRYALGLVPRFDLGKNHYVLNFHPGSLKHAEGSLPLPDGTGEIEVKWSRQDDGIHYAVKAPQPVWLHIKDDQDTALKIEAEHQLLLP